MNFSDPKTDFDLNAARKEPTTAMVDHGHQRKELINGNYHNVDKKDSNLVNKKPTTCMPDFNEEADMLEWAGLSFGSIDTYAMAHSLKKLACLSGADKLRFAGKIMGSEQDYWVACGQLKEDLLESDPSCEARGVGCNATVYWVTDNVLHDWVQLPDVRPEQIVASRQVKKIMTGNLNASIESNPPFPGKERHFLRAMLARIFHAT